VESKPPQKNRAPTAPGCNKPGNLSPFFKSLSQRRFSGGNLERVGINFPYLRAEQPGIKFIVEQRSITTTFQPFFQVVLLVIQSADFAFGGLTVRVPLRVGWPARLTVR
jgi:hypothetical protein